MKEVRRGLSSTPTNDEGVPLVWIEFCNSGLKPSDIPDRPDLVYSDEWQGWEDFLQGQGKED